MDWPRTTARQAGVISRRQLLSLGNTVSAIDALIRSRRLETTRWSGIYRASGTPVTPETTHWAVILHSGAVLSYLSAAQWWDIDVHGDGQIHVSMPGRKRVLTSQDVRVHRVSLPANSITDRFGMPLTNRPVTILDCLGWLSISDASRLLDRAIQQNWIDISHIDQRLAHQPGRWGNTQLKRLRRAAQAGAHAESERRMIAILNKAGITGWHPNLAVRLPSGRFVLDVAFPDIKVAIEIDGWAFHTNVVRFQADRTKQNALITAGWTPLRFTWWDLTERPEYVVATVKTALATRLLAI